MTGTSAGLMRVFAMSNEAEKIDYFIISPVDGIAKQFIHKYPQSIILIRHPRAVSGPAAKRLERSGRKPVNRATKKAYYRMVVEQVY
jgi:hypothetical protein